MSLYKGNKATESGGSFEVGAYKFRVVSAKVNEQYGSVNYELETWAADGKKGPKILDSLRINHDKPAVLAEVDRRLTTMLGKPEIDTAEQLVGKTGWVVLRKGPKYLEPMPWGGYFDKDKKSATGSLDSILDRIKDAQEYDWTKDAYAVAKAERSGVATPASSDDSDTEPF